MVNSIVNFLGSAKLAIALFFILAVLSIFGTLIPQGQVVEFYFAKYGQTLGKLIQLFQLDDAYHSGWYIAVLFLFMVNLTVCSLKRLPFTLKLYKRDPAEIKLENLPNKLQFFTSTAKEVFVPFVEGRLKFSKAREGLYYKKENPLAHFSVYVVHFSLLVILLGALIGALFGFRGNLTVLEGEETDIVQGFRKKDSIQLDFKVRLNKFILETYSNGMPKEYISNVTFLDGNHTFERIIKVNSPAKHKNTIFYQASYEIIPIFNFKFTLNGKTSEAKLSKLEPLQLDPKISVALSDQREAHGLIFTKLWIINEDTKDSVEIITPSLDERAEGLNMPAMFCFGGPDGISPCEEVNLGGIKLSAQLKGLSGAVNLSVLQVKRDPGNHIVYLGFILMMLGLFLVYYFEPKIYWIYLHGNEEGTEILLGAYAKRDREGIKLRLKDLEERMRGLR